jgi:hypothetical protein
MATSEYFTKLSDWHTEVAIVAKALGPVLGAVEDEGLGAIGYILRDRLDALVESCPLTQI